MRIRVDQAKGKGRGVFANSLIRKGELIESCPVMPIPLAERELVAQTVAGTYSYVWGEHLETLAIALGFGSLYNHSYEPNAAFETDLAGAMIHFVAVREIQPDQEITVNYNGSPEDDTPIWFEKGIWGW